jgi:argininosuccinate lyase
LQPFYRDAERYYYEPMLAANRAHVVMLLKCDILPNDNAKALLTALDTIERQGLDQLRYKVGVEDLFFSMERQLIELVGVSFGGNLQLARSRNDLGYALTRLSLRPLILNVIDCLLQFEASLLKFAREHLHSLMPGYTHTQPAQPTTLAHYVAGVLASLQRDTQRLISAYVVNNQSPLGAAALTGTGFPIDRDLSARLLGFDAVMMSTYDSIAASDNLTDVNGSLSSLGITLSRFTHDMLFWATRESGAIRIDDSFIQISSIMPQKRNPVVLEHIRARISRMLGYSQGILLQCHNIPFGDTQDIEDEIFPQLFGSLETAVEILELYTAVIESLHVNISHLQQRASAGFTTVTELADALVREARLSFREAHQIVSALVSHALENDLAPDTLDAALLSEIAEVVTGEPLKLGDDVIRRALDSRHFVQQRQTLGGSAPKATAAVLEAQTKQLATDLSWIQNAHSRLQKAQTFLAESIAAILAEEN